MHAEVFVNGKLVGRPGMKGSERLYMGVSLENGKGKPSSIKFSADAFGKTGKSRTFKKWKSVNLKSKDKLEIGFRESGTFDSPAVSKTWKIQPEFSVKSLEAAEEMVNLSLDYLQGIGALSSKVSKGTKKAFLSSLGNLHLSVGDMLLQSIAIEFPGLHKKFPVLREISRRV